MKIPHHISQAVIIGLFLLAGVAVASVGACAEGPPQTVEAVFRDLEAGRIENALGRVPLEDRELAAALFEGVIPMIQQFGGIEQIDLDLVELDGDHARVGAFVTWNNGERLETRQTLVRRDGDWLMRVELDTGETRAPEPEGPPQPLHLVGRQRVNPFNVIHVPRPSPGTENVPLRTSFFLMIGTEDPADRVIPDSVSVVLRPHGAEEFALLEQGQAFAPGFSGHMFSSDDDRYGRALAVYVESGHALEPDTQYQVTVTARSDRGQELPEDEGAWSFTTEGAATTHTKTFALDLAAGPDVVWHGEFFNSLAKPAWCTSSPHRLPHYELIAEAQQEFPHAWNLQRDAYLAGFAHRPAPFKRFPNIVRERETRRITRITRDESGVQIHVEDFFGHEQYGIESDRPVTADYHPGDEVLIADGVNSARAHVIEADDAERVVRVTDFDDPADGWEIAYTGPLPREENPHAPGLFPPGGAYLRKFDPVGTPHYYWGRVNQEWDIVHGEYGRRVIPRYASAIGCLAIDGQSGTTAKCLVQHHEVTRRITSHLIERYGDATLEWPWVILNEPDLWTLYWRNRDWEELQRFYDYTSDAILRAFEDHGYDSGQVQVGGLELGAIWGDRHLRLDDFLFHCSPNVDSEDAVTLNAAYADPRLDGKRSRRVERLCGENDGMGAPLDFLSVHTYNSSYVAAAKLVRSKERALEIDPDYYHGLPVVSHETVPTWRSIIDPGAAGMYLGNGYFTSWMTDYQARLLQQGARDARYAYGGDLVLMHWPGIARNFASLNDTARQFQLEDRTELVPKPSHHFVNLLSTLRDEFWVFPLEQVGGHAVSGFAARTDEDLRIVVYAHHHEDTAALSDVTFEVNLELDGVEWDRVTVTEYRFDRDHNSYYRLAQRHIDPAMPERNRVYSEEDFAEVRDEATLRATASSGYSVSDGGRVRVPVNVLGNGTNFVIVDPRSR